MLQGCMEATKLLYITRGCYSFGEVDFWAKELSCSEFCTMEDAVSALSKRCNLYVRFEDYNEIDDKALRQFKLHMKKYPILSNGEEIGLMENPIQPSEHDEACDIFKMRQMLNNLCSCVIDCVERASNGAEQQQTEETQPFPTELDNEQAKKYFARAVEAGLMNEQYEWKASKALLSCFCQEMSNKLCLGKGYSNGQQRISWKPFEKLFGYSDLRGGLNDIKKTGQDPIGIEKINAIFQE